MRKLLIMMVAALAAFASAFADAVRVYDVDDYVQDGLVAHFDAIRNAGAGEAHDSTATTWKNLAGEPDAEFQYRSGSTSDSGGTDISYYFKSDAMATMVDAIDLGTNLTVQIAITSTASSQSTSDKTVDRYNSWFNDNPKNNCGFWTDKQGVKVTGDFRKYISDNQNSGYRLYCDYFEFQYMTYMLDGANHKAYLFQTDEKPEETSGLDIIPLTHKARKYCWGGEDDDGNGSLQAFLTGEYHSVRLYNRVLTDAEIKQNRMVDEARFRTAETKGLVPNVVVVGVDATKASEKYVVSGSETYTAPETVENYKGAFRRYGYVVETWDGTAWSGAVTNLSGTCTVTPGDAKKRITWLWTDILRSYDVDDYVQDGLVAHFDAIRNAGADTAHDAEATIWKNLVAGRADAAFNTNDGVWTDNGFCVSNNCVAYMKETLDLGVNFTIQLATDVDLDAQKVISGTWGYRNYFNALNDLNGIWTDNRIAISKTLVGNFNHYKNQSGDVRPEIANWGGQYATKILETDGTSGYAYMFESDTLPTDAAKKKSITLASTLPDAVVYDWGGLTTWTKDGKLVYGTYHSVRIYTNALGNAALRQNRIVDDARFREGRCDVTIVNGEIGETGTKGESSFADGGYNMGEGESWTLTAESVTVDGKTYQSRLTIETLTDGEWVQTERLWTESYTVDKTALAGSHIRLTWTWEKRNGLVITFQ